MIFRHCKQCLQITDVDESIIPATDILCSATIYHCIIELRNIVRRTLSQIISCIGKFRNGYVFLHSCNVYSTIRILTNVPIIISYCWATSITTFDTKGLIISILHILLSSDNSRYCINGQISTSICINTSLLLDRTTINCSTFPYVGIFEESFRAISQYDGLWWYLSWFKHESVGLVS